MVARIRLWSSRHLSYAGRVILINSVLMSIHSYWAQIMLLPKQVLQKINSICRDFLWKGVAEHGRPGYVAWNDLCKPKQERGLGFRKIVSWNKAALGKYFWALASKQNTLWVKWVHNVYLKNRLWWSYNSKSNSSWYWRQIVQVKEEIKKVCTEQAFKSTPYLISKGYCWLVPS